LITINNVPQTCILNFCLAHLQTEYFLTDPSYDSNCPKNMETRFKPIKMLEIFLHGFTFLNFETSNFVAFPSEQIRH